MTSREVEREIRELLDVLDGSGEAGSVLVVSDEPGPLVAELAERFPRARMHVVVDTARDPGLAPGERVEVSTGFPADGWAELAVVRISGYEGNDRLAARIAAVHRAMAEGGRHLAISHKRRGARSHEGLLSARFGNAETLGRGSGGVRILGAVRTAPAADDAPVAGEEPTIEETVLGERFVFRTGSVFSRERLDWGTRFLLETLETGGARRLLDLGCGYGPIAIVLARLHPELRATMVDVEVEAVRLAEANAHLNGVDARVRAVLSDGLKAIPGERFDLVLTHFPLHIPRPELVRILAEARDALEPGGRLCGVALSAYDVRASVLEAFGNVATVAETPDGYPFAYRVVCAETS
jgi:16S rRNA (guanine1207-N2)-methyltransferase